jgi:spore germination protein YaaH
VTTGRAGFYDYNALVAAIDELFVMAWNQHWSTSKPGPLSSIAWYTRIADYLTTVGPASKITMGSQLYGMDWPNAVDAKTYNGAPAVPYEWPAVQALIARTGATPQWDPVMGESFFTYSESGVPHTVWFADAAYVQARFAVARARGFGVGAWRLGSEDRAIWNIQELSS